MKTYDKTRYFIASEDIAEFVRRSWEIYELVRLKLVLIWKWLRRPTKMEREWYELMEGKYTATKHIVRNTELRIEFKKKYSDVEYKNYKKKIQNQIKLYGENISHLVIQLKTKYRDLMNRFPSLLYYLLDLVIAKQYTSR
jgi:hypothetical protein